MQAAKHVYSTRKAPDTVNLTDMETDAAARWVDTWTGERKNAGVAPQKVMTFQKPAGFGQAPAMLIITTRASAPRTAGRRYTSSEQYDSFLSCIPGGSDRVAGRTDAFEALPFA